MVDPNTPKRTRPTAFFDAIDVIDRRIYGWRMRLLIWTSILVLIIAPLADEYLFKDPEDNTTHIFTWLFLIFVIILILGFIGSWRDENGIWTWYQTRTRLRTHLILGIGKRSTLENVYRAAWFIFFTGVVWKAFQNLSIFIRKPIEHLTHKRIVFLRHFELYTKHHYFILLLIGGLIILWLMWKDPKMFKRKVKNDLLHLLGLYYPKNQYYSPNEMAMVIENSKGLVINSKDYRHVNSTIAASKSKLFNDFLIATRSWETGFYKNECEYQIRFAHHLARNLPGATIDMEFKITNAATGKSVWADIVINETILVEMKNDDSSSAIQRAKGQIFQYSEVWKEKGPVILLLCNYEYENARLSYSSTMQDLVKLKRTALTVLAIPK